jgi:hypothetical protein
MARILGYEWEQVNKAAELAKPRKGCWRKIAIALIVLVFGEQMAQACANA